MSCLHDAHTAEVDSEDVEGGVCRALEDTAQATNKRISAIGRHRINHHTSSATTRERFHQSRRQGTHEIAVSPTGFDTPSDAVDQHVHRPRSAKNADSNEDSHEVGDNPDCCRKAILRSLDKGIVDVHLLPQSSQDKGDDDQHQHDVSCRGAHLVHQHGVELSKAPDNRSHQDGSASKRQQHCAVQQIDPLEDTRDDDACKRREERSQQDGDEDIRRLCCSQLGAIH